jgi:hypothetical protein
MNLRITIALAFTFALLGGSTATAQVPRTEAAARQTAITWLRAQGRTIDTARIVASREELWERFVTCEQPEQRVGCTIRGGGSITMLNFRISAPDTITFNHREYFLITHSCPLGIPLTPPVIGTLGDYLYEIVYARGAWQDPRRVTAIVC